MMHVTHDYVPATNLAKVNKKLSYSYKFFGTHIAILQIKPPYSKDFTFVFHEALHSMHKI